MKYLLAAAMIFGFASNAHAVNERDLDSYIVEHGGSTVYHDETPPEPAKAEAPAPAPETVRLIAYGATKIIKVGRSASRTMGIGSSVAQKCQDKYNNDNGMIEYCMNQQNAARDRIGNLSVPQMCWDKYNKDYEMVEYCANEQNAARDRVMGK